MSTQVMTVVEEFATVFSKERMKSFLKLMVNHGTPEILKMPLKNMIQGGNLKIPRTTAIFNMSSATDCASLALGLCKACVLKDGELKTVCYALKSERDYRPNVLPYRRRQQILWNDTSAESFALQFLLLNSMKPKPFDKIRFNEAGDFHGPDCVKKADRIAKLLKPHGVVCYCYTSRDDLDYSRVRDLVINGSGFKKAGIMNEFKFVEKGAPWPKGYAKCPADCRKCDRCSVKGKDTFIVQH